MWLDGAPKLIPSPEDMPDGVGFFIRARDGKHRYSITPGSLVVKRRRHSGNSSTMITTITTFRNPPHREWLSFSLEATRGKIVFHIGDQTGEITGPLDMDGDNRIALGKGSKLTGVRLELLNQSGKIITAGLN